MYNETRDENGVLIYGNSNISKAIRYFEYAAEEGEVHALNALAILYMNGYEDPKTKRIIVR
jgi:TPR repeat protein